MIVGLETFNIQTGAGSYVRVFFELKQGDQHLFLFAGQDRPTSPGERKKERKETRRGKRYQKIRKTKRLIKGRFQTLRRIDAQKA
jgi:hypothetical protein